MTRVGWVVLIVWWAVLTYWTIWCFVKIWRALFAQVEDENDQRDVGRKEAFQLGLVASSSH